MAKPVNPKVYSREYFLEDCEGWNQWAEQKDNFLSPRLSYALSLVKIRSDMKVLDFGCGRGEITVASAEKGAQVYAVDYAKAAIELCQKSVSRLPSATRRRVKIIQADTKQLEIKPGTIDLIFFLDVFEHLTDDELQKSLSKFLEFLKPGGRLVIHTSPSQHFMNIGYPLYTRWANIFANPLWKLAFKESKLTTPNPRSNYEKRVHINEQTLDSVTTWLHKIGFKSKAWLDSRYHMIRIRDKLNYWFLMPIWIPMFSRYFQNDIWAIAVKPRKNK